jgi:hypothetical protein
MGYSVLAAIGMSFTWIAVKVTDVCEAVQDDGTIVRRERERFMNALTLVFASGETAILR